MTQELCQAVASGSAIAVRGGGTKNGLGTGPALVTELDLTALEGIMTYDPSEFLITARAGTRISTLVAALAEHGQYLPFDPVFADMAAQHQGATLGGTIASGISGANRLLYGSLRDFVMEVELIDGLGRLVRGGGKVVKNSAGFDLPKLMVGSYGRLGVLTEATLKVFPKPPAYVTQRFEFASTVATLAAMQKLQTNPLPISAIDLEPPTCLVARYAGRLEALGTVAARAELLLGQASEQVVTDECEAKYWEEVSAFAFLPEECGLIRIAMSGRKLLAVEQALQSLAAVSAVRYSGGASVAWLTVGVAFDYAELDQRLTELGLAGIVVRCGTRQRDGLQLLGDKSWVRFSERIQRAMDPDGKFPRFECQEMPRPL